MQIDKDALVGGMTGTVVSLSGAAISVGDIYIWINIVLGVVGFVITLATTVVIPLIKWGKKAKEDGKISAEEIQELSDLLEATGKSVEDIKKSLEEKDDDKIA